MIDITANAAAQIRTSAKDQHLEGLALRVAAQRLPDGKLHYAMGFDEPDASKDLSFNSEGIEVIVSPVSLELLKGTTIDYVEMEDNTFEFIFMNPNDPNYQAPTEE
jgi:iron-sulfur cluster assembly protein